MLVGVLVLIVLVGFLLFRFGMSFFEAGRPDPSTLPTSTPGPVVVPPTLAAGGSPVAGASPSPGAGTVISPGRVAVAGSGRRPSEGRQHRGAGRQHAAAPVDHGAGPADASRRDGGGGDRRRDEQAEGRGWRNVRDQDGATGWVASELLAPE